MSPCPVVSVVGWLCPVLGNGVREGVEAAFGWVGDHSVLAARLENRRVFVVVSDHLADRLSPTFEAVRILKVAVMGEYQPNDPVHPFSNGDEYRAFTSRNCEGCRSYRPMATSSRDGCPMEVAMAMASIGDGEIKAKHALRAGLLEAEGGKIVDRKPPYEYAPVCPERRGKNEPDDRPKRGPRPPKGQMDLLDPRLAPTRQSAISAPSSNGVSAITEKAEG